MKATSLWAEGSKPTISFELYPPKTEKAAASLDRVIEKLSALNPQFMSVTFGAGGSTREGSRDLVKKLLDKGINVIAYFAGFGLSPDEISNVLDTYQTLGVDNVLIVRGDKPQDETFQPHPDSFEHATDLLSFIRPKYAFCLGVAGYPEGHVEAASLESDIDFLKKKVDLGAEFIIANYFYDNQYYFDFLERCEKAEIRVPIVPGVMPIYNVKMLHMLAGLCGATVTEKIQKDLAKIPTEDKDALNEYGVALAVDQCRELLISGVPGLHIYTMDRSKSAIPIVTQLQSSSHLT